MTTIFERIPDLFVERYDEQFRMWAREFKKRGKFAAIVFDRMPGQIVLLDATGSPIWKGAWFEADVDKSNPQQVKVIIKPRTDHDAEMVEKHVRDLLPHMLH